MNTPSLPFNRASLILSSYGNGYAIGGPAEVIEQIANTIANYDHSQPVVIPHGSLAPEFVAAGDLGDQSPNFSTAHRRHPEVHRTHKTFAYLVVSRDSLVEAFYHLRHNAIQRYGNRSQIRRAVELARHLCVVDFDAIKRENFAGFNAGRNSFIAELEPSGIVSADTENDWQAGEFQRGADKAFRDTAHASK